MIKGTRPTRILIAMLAVGIGAMAQTCSIHAEGPDKRLPPFVWQPPSTPDWACRGVVFYLAIAGSLGASYKAAVEVRASLLPEADYIDKVLQANPSMSRDAVEREHHAKFQRLTDSLANIVAAAAKTGVRLDELKMLRCIDEGDGRPIALVLAANGSELPMEIFNEMIGGQLFITEVTHASALRSGNFGENPCRTEDWTAVPSTRTVPPRSLKLPGISARRRSQAHRNGGDRAWFADAQARAATGKEVGTPRSKIWDEIE